MKVVIAAILFAQAQTDDIPSSMLDAAVKGISGYRGANEAKPIGDEAFLRRSYKDLLDAAPAVAEIKAFVDDPDPKKRAVKIGQLVSDDRFDDFWARRFSEVFFGDPEKLQIDLLDKVPGTEARAVKEFERWLRGRFKKDAPWTEIVSQMLSARGRLDAEPATAYMLLFNRGKGLAAEFPKGMPRHLLGIRLNCAECHDQPYDRWRTEDFYSLSSFAIRQRARMVGGVPQIKYGEEGEAAMPVLTASRDANVKIARGGTADPNFLFGGQAGKSDDRMTALAQFMTNKSNTQLPRALANRVWGWLFGFGIVHPVDDFNLKNKAASPAMMEILVRDTIANNYSLKRLVRVICSTKAYQMPLPEEAPDAESFRHIVGSRMARGRYYPATSRSPALPLKMDVPADWTRMMNGSVKGLFVVPGRRDPLQKAELTLFDGKKDSGFLETVTRQTLQPRKNAQVLAGNLSVTLSEVSGLNTCIRGAEGPTDYVTLVALVEPAEGPFTFRFEGPASVVNDRRDEFIAFLKTVASK